MLSWGGPPPSQNNRFRREKQSRRTAAHYPNYLITEKVGGTNLRCRLYVSAVLAETAEERRSLPMHRWPHTEHIWTGERFRSGGSLAWSPM